MVAWLPLIGGFLLDALVGDPYRLPHPVRWIGAWIAYLERRLRKEETKDNEADKKAEAGAVAGGDQKLRRKGRLLVFLVLLAVTGSSFLLLFLAYRTQIVVGLAVETVLCAYLLSARCLVWESEKVYRHLKDGSLQKAREALSMIVGRDTEALPQEAVIRAAVETVAESASDGVGAPLFYLSLGGAVFGFFYKAVNTMDSMLGYRSVRYIDFGRCAARLDDVLNYLPSRLTALFMMAASFLLGFDGAGAFRIFWRDRKKHESPNAGQTESVMAGALGLCLAGDAYYGGRLVKKPLIGDAKRSPEPEDIRRANRLMYGTSVLCLLAAIGVRVLLWTLLGRLFGLGIGG